jgi:hypothetical protein
MTEYNTYQLKFAVGVQRGPTPTPVKTEHLPLVHHNKFQFVMDMFFAVLTLQATRTLTIVALNQRNSFKFQ